MKKTLLLLLCIIMAMGMQAQTQTQEHLKFMGIPLDGTISQFHSKLLAKGFKYDDESSFSGVREYNGIFSGEDAIIFVYYNTSSKIVYRAKAAIKRDTEDLIKKEYDDFKRLLSTKYKDAYIMDDEQEDYPSCTIFISNLSDDILGTIGLYISKHGPSYDEVYALHIDYEDLANEKDNEDKRLEDL